MGIIAKYLYGWKARRLYKEMRHAARASAAAVVIQKYFRGWLVSAGGGEGKVPDVWGGGLDVMQNIELHVHVQ